MKDILIADVKDVSDKPSDKNADSFFNFNDAKVKMLEPGDRLWRFSTDHEKYFSDCWVDNAQMENVFRIFADQKAQNEFGIKILPKWLRILFEIL